MTVRSSPRWWVRTAGAACALAVLSGCAGQSQPEQPDQREAVTTFGRLAYEATTTGEVAPSLNLFALQFGPLPGVPVPADGQGEPRDANLAVSAVFNVWSRLTVDQQAAIRDALGLDPGFVPRSPVDYMPEVKQSRAVTTSAATTSAAKMSANSARGARARVAPAAVRTARDISAHVAAGRAVEVAMANHLGPLGVPVVYRASDRAPVTNGTPALASALVTAGECRITIYPTLAAPSGPSVTLAHELTHCYQQVWRAANYLPRSMWWLQEGSAEWAGSVIASELGGSGDSSTFANLGEWIHTPATTLTSRSYDAYGLFAFANMNAGDLWSRLRAATTASGTAAAITQLRGSMSQADFVSGWATSQVHRSNLGAQWTISGPGVPTDPRQEPISYEEHGNGAEATMAAPAWANARWARRVSAETIRITVGSGTHGAVALPGGTRVLAELAGQAWCTSTGGDCTCPADTARAGEQLPRLDAAELVAAAGAGASATTATLRGRSLREECGDAPACPVGSWELEQQAPIPRVTVESGGTGTRLFITADGRVTQDFNQYVPLTAKGAGRSPITVYLAPTGIVTALISIPVGSPFAASPVTDVDASGLSGTAYTQIGRDRVDIPVATLRDMGVALGNSQANRGPVKLRCVGTDRIVLEAAPGVTQGYRRIG